MVKHWSEKLFCACGATFKTAIAEARHRHNYPAYCKKPKPKKGTPK